MSVINKWGFAFPLPAYPQERGMSLRDYFAAKALAGLLANPSLRYVSNGDTEGEAYATAAYNYADAMLEARK